VAKITDCAVLTLLGGEVLLKNRPWLSQKVTERTLRDSSQGEGVARGATSRFRSKSGCFFFVIPLFWITQVCRAALLKEIFVRAFTFWSNTGEIPL